MKGRVHTPLQARADPIRINAASNGNRAQSSSQSWQKSRLNNGIMRMSHPLTESHDSQFSQETGYGSGTSGGSSRSTSAKVSRSTSAKRSPSQRQTIHNFGSVSCSISRDSPRSSRMNSVNTSRDYSVTNSRDYSLNTSRDYSVTGSRDYSVTTSRDYSVNSSREFRDDRSPRTSSKSIKSREFRDSPMARRTPSKNHKGASPREFRDDRPSPLVRKSGSKSGSVHIKGSTHRSYSTKKMRTQEEAEVKQVRAKALYVCIFHVVFISSVQYKILNLLLLIFKCQILLTLESNHFHQTINVVR